MRRPVQTIASQVVPTASPVAPILFVLSALLLAGCPSSRPRPPVVAPPPPPAFPVSELIPADAPLVLILREVRQGVTAVRAALKPLGLVERYFALANLESELRRYHGVNLLDLKDFARVGFDPDGDAALFWQGSSFTLLLPVEDPKRLNTYLAERTAQGKTFVKRHGELAVTTWRKSSHERISFVVLPGYLALDYAALPGGGLADGAKRVDGLAEHGWIDRMLRRLTEKRDALAQAPAFAALLRRAKEKRDVVALLRPSRFNSEMAAAYRHIDTSRADPTRCAAATADLAQLEELGLALRLQGKRVKLAAWLTLSKGAREALKGWVGAPLALPAGIWDEAPARASLSLDLDPALGRLERWPQGHSSSCGLLVGLVQETRYLRRMLGRSPLRSKLRGRLAAAALAAGVEGQQLRVRAAAVTPSPAGGLPRPLRMLLSGVWARKETLGGRQVHRINAPVVLADAIRVALGEPLRITLGEGMMEQLLAHKPAASAARLVGSVRLQPGRLDLQGLMGYGPLQLLIGQQRGLRELLQTIDAVELEARLGDPGLVLKGGYSLR